MPEFTYRVRDPQGRSVAGVMERDSQAAVLGALRQLGYVPVSVAPRRVAWHQTELRIPFLSGRVKLRDLAISSRQLAGMIGAGLPLLRALTVLTEQTESRVLAKTWSEVRQDVERGSSFSASLAKHPRSFDGLFVAMVQAGETGGVLDEVLVRLADTYESQVKIRNKVKSAMTYPTMVGLLVLVVLTVILVFVVPTFRELYRQLGGTLPAPTRILISVSSAVKRYFLVIIAAIIVGTFLCRRYLGTEEGRTQADLLKLKLPVFGPLFRKATMSRFTRTLGTLLRSGVPVLESFEITQRTVQNKFVASAIKDVQNSVSEGESLARPLERHSVFPPIVVQMLAVGEETGAVDSMLEKVADFYDAEVEASVEGLTALIEPLLIATLASVVGGILIALYLPMFRLINLIK